MHSAVNAIAGAFLIGCAVLVVVGCSGVGSEAPQEEQGQTETTKKEQARSPEATASGEARCAGTRSFHRKGYLGSYVTNDVPGCPKGGLLSGTDGQDNLAGMDGDDKIRGLGDQDALFGGPGNDFLAGAPNNREEGRYKSNDVLYGGPGSDVLHGGAGADFLYSYSQSGGGLQGKDVLYGGDGNDTILADDYDKQDKLYCGEGWDRYIADKGDFVSSSCEKKWDGTVS
jgi:Ca2+-binding RTX toxin-like protein